MLIFTTPSLLPLLALLVPLALYLWNRRPGREVPVGSLRWLTAGANRRLRSLRRHAHVHSQVILLMERSDRLKSPILFVNLRESSHLASK